MIPCEVILESLSADKLPLTHAAQVQKGMLPDMSGEGGKAGSGVVTEQAGEGTLRPVDQ